MSKVIKMKSLNGVTLNTKEKFIDDNITIVPDLPVYTGETELKPFSEIDELLSRTITTFSSYTLKTIGAYAFANCSNLEEINLPNATKVSMYGFQNTGLKKLYLPKVVTIGSNAIYNNTRLKEIKLDSINSLDSGAIRGSVVLVRLIITNPDKVCTANAANTFAECYHLSGTTHATHNPNGLQDGRIYVPDHLVEDYKKAQYWSAFANIIVPLSELKEEE